MLYGNVQQMHEFITMPNHESLIFRPETGLMNISDKLTAPLKSGGLGFGLFLMESHGKSWFLV